MTTATHTTQDLDLARTAALAALAVLPASSPLTVGEPGPVPATPAPGQAVSARFAGAVQGEIVIVVGQDLADALSDSPLGPLDLAKALQPAIEAATGTLGQVVVDPGQAMEPGVALDALTSKGTVVYVPLEGESGQAAVALLLSPWPGAPQATVAAEPSARAPIGADRLRTGLDLLQDVEMEVSAELGRTRMSVRELLSLSPGAVVELDRAAGSPADLLVNGRLIARGEVVVIDENFGIRITEIVAPGSERV